jgi:archaemetzincin
MGRAALLSLGCGFYAGNVPFRPPSAAERLAALGPTESLPEPLRRALEAEEDFDPIPEPGPHDWLAHQVEPGQTFQQFVDSRPPRPEPHRNVLYLQPLGEFPCGQAPPLDQLRRFASAFFMMNAQLLPPVDPASTRITHRRNRWTGRVQWLTGDILELLRRRKPPDAVALLGITMTDLYPEPGWNFVFGQAWVNERVGVYSFARYDPQFYGEPRKPDWMKLLLRRSVKVLAHEIGHMCGLAHCIWYRCLMNGSNHLEESDARPLHLCPVDLRKLQWSLGFDVVQRYRRLLDFHRAAGFDDEVRWIERRLARIEGAGRA